MVPVDAAQRRGPPQPTAPGTVLSIVPDTGTTDVPVENSCFQLPKGF